MDSTIDFKKTSSYDYYLDNNLIAQKPLKTRSNSRLMVIKKKENQIIDDKFINLINYINKDDLMIFNSTKVIKARIFGNKIPTNAKIEIFIEHVNPNGVCNSFVKPGKRVSDNTEIRINNEITAVIKKKLDAGEAEIIFYSKKNGKPVYFDNITDIYNMLDTIGNIPLLPYIKEKIKDDNRYQTIYADKKGSVAAPTAGLHFTSKYIDKIKTKGIKTSFINLFVGAGTFQPVKSNLITNHNMHFEDYEILPETSELLNTQKENGSNILTVGTTSLRCLEANYLKKNKFSSEKSSTNLFIYPPKKVKSVDKLLTNFHLPKSTLLMLVTAFGGYELVMKAYHHAVKEKYRFFSFGDEMLIL